MKIMFLIHNVYGVGGTIRTTLNLATALADRHDIEIVSMLRHRARPRFEIDGRITLTPLVDIRPGSQDLQDPLLQQPARVFPGAEKRYGQYSELTDLRAEEKLRGCDADVVIGTRPGINVYLARFAPRRALRIAQEHLYHDVHRKRLRAVLAREYRQLDALVTTTRADAAVYARRMRLPGVRIAAVPNSVPAPDAQALALARSSAPEPVQEAAPEPVPAPVQAPGPLPAQAPAQAPAPARTPDPVPASASGSTVIAAAGRLVPGKRFDLLIDAFADIAPAHPEWKLRIYGSGSDKKRLQHLIDERGVAGQAELRGFKAPIEAEFAKAALVAVTSEAESFGMTLVEAMRCGVPVVSTDCPLGPAEIIHDEVDGRLVPVGDREALAAALHELIADPGTRRRMGEAALVTSKRYDPAPIARTYDELFADLVGTRKSRARERQLALWKGRLRGLGRRFGR